MRLVYAALLLCAAQGQSLPPGVDFIREVELLARNRLAVSQILTDGAGSVYLLGTAWDSPSPKEGFSAKIGPGGGDDLFAIKLDSALTQVQYAVLIGGSKDDGFTSAAVDAKGNLYLAGAGTSEDFPVEAPDTRGGFLVKLDPRGTALEYAITLGLGTQAGSLQVDDSGAVYLGGSTRPGLFPATPGVPQPFPIPDVHPTDTVGVVAKYDADGSLIFATGIRDAGIRSPVVGLTPQGDLAVASSRSLMVLAASGMQVLWSVETGLESSTVKLDAAGNVFTAGLNAGAPTVKKYSPLGVDLFSTAILHGFRAPQPVMTVTPAGRVHLFLSRVNVTAPLRNPVLPCPENRWPSGARGSGLVVLSSEGEELYSTWTASEVMHASLVAGGQIYTTAGFAVVQYDAVFVPSDHTAVSCIAHSATLQPVPPTPGALMTVFGDRLGPADGTAFELVNDRVPLDTGGVRVTVDGQPAPVLYAQNEQLNFITPWSVRTDGYPVTVCVSYSGEESCVTAITGMAQPAAFRLPDGRTAAINQDGTINSEQHPAPRGSVVAVYLTGTGPLDIVPEDGAVAGLPLARVAGEVTAEFAPDPPICPPPGACGPSHPPYPATVHYAGSSPGLVYGVAQVNVEVPREVPARLRSFTLKFANSGMNAGGSVWVGP